MEPCGEGGATQAADSSKPRPVQACLTIPCTATGSVRPGTLLSTAAALSCQLPCRRTPATGGTAARTGRTQEGPATMHETV